MLIREWFNSLLRGNPVFWISVGVLSVAAFSWVRGISGFLLSLFAFAFSVAGTLLCFRPHWEKGLSLLLCLLVLFLLVVQLGCAGISVGALVFGAFGALEIARCFFLWRGEPEPETESPGPRKRKRIAALLEGLDGTELLGAVFSGIVRRYGGNLNVMDLQDHERAFLLAYDAWGIIGNGGFNYLFERRIRGDPHFFATTAAFEVIGCQPAVEAFQKAFQLFPDGRPPEDVAERLHIYRSGPGSKRAPIDSQFWAASKEIENALLAHVRAYAAEFAELDRLPLRKKRRKKPKRRKIQAEDGDVGPNGSEVQQLPHWARVAFAARCGRHVWPLFLRNWPDARKERRQAVLTALELVERSAAAAQPAEGLQETELAVSVAAGAAMFGLYGDDFFAKKDREPLPPDGNAALIASFVANTIAYAVAAARAMPAKSVESALAAFRFARQAAGRDEELHEAMEKDLTQLQRVALLGEWSDGTPVPPTVWDLLSSEA